MPPRTTCAPPRSRWRRRAIGCAFSARPTRRSPTSRRKVRIDPATLTTAPIAGTIVTRKVGRGQYVGSGSTDPVFIIGDLSTVWVVAFIRETEAPMVHVGQAIYFTVLAYPDRSFPAN